MERKGLYYPDVQESVTHSGSEDKQELQKKLLKVRLYRLAQLNKLILLMSRLQMLPQLL
ncbi:hypothetical protein BANRA_04117 [Acinetobacter baumannii]|nr:hypothetical protein BANRA_04117 [Acinetobacter baumannii]